MQTLSHDPRGFALKFYTDEGNFDLVGNNTPVFFVRDASNFWKLSPESAYQLTILMSDRGTPRTYRNMTGYSSHTFSTINASGDQLLGQIPLQDGPRS